MHMHGQSSFEQQHQTNTRPVTYFSQVEKNLRHGRDAMCHKGNERVKLHEWRSVQKRLMSCQNSTGSKTTSETARILS